MTDDKSDDQDIAPGEFDHSWGESVELADATVDDIDEAPVKTRRDSEDDARVVLLFFTFFLLFLTITAGFLVAVWGGNAAWERTSELLQAVIPVETLVLGAAVSYYFKNNG